VQLLRLSNNSGVIEYADSQAFGRYVFSTLGNEAKIIIYYWPCYVKFSLLRTALSVIRLRAYRTAFCRISLLYDVTSRDVRKLTVKTVIRRILRIRERIADLSWTKSCGERYIVRTLTNMANISI